MGALSNRPRYGWVWLVVAAVSLSFLLSGSVGEDLARALEGDASNGLAERYDLEPSLQAPPGTDIYYGTPGRPASEPAPRLTAADYPRYGGVDSRLAIWVVTQQHTYFGGFVLALPIFCFIIEMMGLLTRDPVAAVRYDRLARDFLRISLIAFSISALLGGALVAALLMFYPAFFRYITGVFKSMMGVYALVFLAESWALYLYYYSWDRLSQGGRKWLHAAIGVVVNVFGTLLLFLANSWVSFMMSPAGVDEDDRRGRGLGVLRLPLPHGKEPRPEKLLRLGGVRVPVHHDGGVNPHAVCRLLADAVGL